MAPLIIASAGLSLADRLRAFAVHVPYALAAQLAVPFLGAPAPPLGLMSQLPLLPPTHELYIYSRADRLVSAAASWMLTPIETHARDRERCGSHVSLFEMDGSAHCEHYKRHPAKYAAAVSAFVERVESAHQASRQRR